MGGDSSSPLPLFKAPGTSWATHLTEGGWLNSSVSSSCPVQAEYPTTTSRLSLSSATPRDFSLAVTAPWAPQRFLDGFAAVLADEQFPRELGVRAVSHLVSCRPVATVAPNNVAGLQGDQPATDGRSEGKSRKGRRTRQVKLFAGRSFRWPCSV